MPKPIWNVLAQWQLIKIGKQHNGQDQARLLPVITAAKALRTQQEVVKTSVSVSPYLLLIYVNFRCFQNQM